MIVRHLSAAIVAAAALLVVASPISAKPQAQTTDLTGSYSVSGTNPTGTTYIGTLDISSSQGTLSNGTAYQLKWTINNQTSTGLGVLYSSNTFAVAFGDTNCVLNIYDLSNSQGNAITGVWSNISTQSFGSENLTFTKSLASDHVSAQYAVAGTNPDNTTYKGNMVLDGYGLIYNMTWTVGSATNKGVGLLLANPAGIISADGATSSAVCNVASYQALNGNLYGTWVSVGDKVTGTELAVKN